MTSTPQASSTMPAAARPMDVMPHGSSNDRIELLGLSFDPVSETECVRRIIRDARRDVGGWVVTPNLDILRQCVADSDLMELINRADMIVADGMPLVWASRLQRTPLPERVCGSNLIISLTEEASHEGLSIFFLGGAEGAAEAAAEELKQRYPRFLFKGCYFPPFGFEQDEAEMSNMRAMLSEAQPSIVYVALSFPKGERLIAQLRDALPGTWWVGVGISFSFVSGDVKRAPRWMRRIGLEWVHRLMQEPRRLWRRYLHHGIPFAARLFAHVIRRRNR